MSQPVFAVEPGVPQKEAWALMKQERVKALPVVDDADGVVLGIVSISDFVRQATLDAPEGVATAHSSFGHGAQRAKSRSRGAHGD